MRKMFSAAIAALALSVAAPAMAAQSITCSETFSAASCTMYPTPNFSTPGADFFLMPSGATLTSDALVTFDFNGSTLGFGTTSAGYNTVHSTSITGDVTFTPTIPFTSIGTATIFGVSSLTYNVTDGGAFTLHFNNSTFADLSSGGFIKVFTTPVTAPVPEPATWAMMLLGFGAIGFQMQRKRARHTDHLPQLA